QRGAATGEHKASAGRLRVKNLFHPIQALTAGRLAFLGQTDAASGEPGDVEIMRSPDRLISQHGAQSVIGGRRTDVARHRLWRSSARHRFIHDAAAEVTFSFDVEPENLVDGLADVG